MANSNSWAVFIVDPGRVTGCARALVDLRQPTVAKCLQRAWRKGVLQTWEVTGSYEEQSWEIAQSACDWFFVATVERGAVRDGNWSYCTERFDPRTLAADFIPMEINAAVKTLLSKGHHGKPMWDNFEAVYNERQMASHAKSFVTDHMLQKWGWAWKGRSAHERDAIRHLGARVNDMLNGTF